MRLTVRFFFFAETTFAVVCFFVGVPQLGYSTISQAEEHQQTNNSEGRLRNNNNKQLSSIDKQSPIRWSWHTSVHVRESWSWTNPEDKGLGMRSTQTCTMHSDKKKKKRKKKKKAFLNRGGLILTRRDWVKYSNEATGRLRTATTTKKFRTVALGTSAFSFNRFFNRLSFSHKSLTNFSSFSKRPAVGSCGCRN